MKPLLKTILLLLAFSIPTLADDSIFDWSGLEGSQISLEAPLLIVKGSSGFLGCGCEEEFLATYANDFEINL